MGFPITNILAEQGSFAVVEDNVRSTVVLLTSSDYLATRTIDGETWTIRLSPCQDGRVAVLRNTGGNTYSCYGIYRNLRTLSINLGALLFTPVFPSFSAIDSTPPSVPVISSVVDGATGLVTDNFNPDEDLVISGTADAESYVKINLNGAFFTIVQADTGGLWSFDILSGLESGSYSFTVIGFDVANNTSAESTATVKTVV